MIQPTYQDGYLQFGNGGIQIDTVNDFDFAVITKEVEEVRKDFDKSPDACPDLIGQLDTSLYLSKSKPVIERLALKMAREHEQKAGHWHSCKMNFSIEQQKIIDAIEMKGNPVLFLESLWVNFQRRYEYQPIHDHRGIYSFIIFYEIPYLMKDEIAVSPGKNSSQRKAGVLSFHYVNYEGKIRGLDIPADTNWKKRMILFPATLMHSVYPFFSTDKYRITISGNLAPIYVKE